MIMIKAQCHCGQVQIELTHKPDYINDCNCSLCSAAGAIWGYYEGAAVRITGDRSTYVRADYPLAAVAIHSCTRCGTTTDWTITEKYQAEKGPMDRCGVNMRLFDPGLLEGVEVRFPDGRAWTGEEDYGYRRDPIIMGRDAY